MTLLKTRLSACLPVCLPFSSNKCSFNPQAEATSPPVRYKRNRDALTKFALPSVAVKPIVLLTFACDLHSRTQSIDKIRHSFRRDIINHIHDTRPRSSDPVYTRHLRSDEFDYHIPTVSQNLPDPTSSVRPTSLDHVDCQGNYMTVLYDKSSMYAYGLD